MVILPDGAGRLDVEVVFGGQQSDGIRDEVARGRQLVDECRRRIGGTWEGIAFWTDEVAQEKPGETTGWKPIHYRGSAWFRDAAALNLTGQRWVWKPRDDQADASGNAGGHHFEFAFDPLPALEAGDDRAAQFKKWNELLEGFEVTLRMRLPGVATIVSGRGVAEGREVTYHLDREDLAAGARMPEPERAGQFHRLVITTGPPVAEASVEMAAFHQAWATMERVAVPHDTVATPRPPVGPAPPPLPLDPPLILAEADSFYAVPDSAPDWKLDKTQEDAQSEWWTGSIRGARAERIPVIIRVPRTGRPCPVAVKQHTWHGTKESGQETGLPVLLQGIAVVSFDGPLVGSRAVEGRDPLGESPELAADNHRWAVSDLRAVIRALGDVPLPAETVTTAKGVVVAGVSLGGPTAISAFALEQHGAAAGVTVVAGAGAWSAARDAEPPGTSLEGAGDMRLRTTPDAQREAALLDPAMIVPLTRPRPIAIIGGADDGFAPETALRRLARSVEHWPEVLLRVHPGVGHFITDAQAGEVTDWIVRQANALR